MKEIKLPIDVKEVSPLKPDFKRLGKMLLLLTALLLGSYIILIIMSGLLVKSISIEEEKQLFQGFFETQEKLEISQLTHGFEIPYEVYITHDLEANAYALPGAIIYVTQGLLDSIEYEEELIFILGHEISHIENRDVLVRVSKQLPFRFVLAALGLDIGITGMSLGDIGGNYSSHITEKKADLGGVNLVNSAGLNLECAVGFFERNKVGDSNVEAFLSTHPSDQSRIDMIKQSAKFGGDCTAFEYKK